jgi:cytochrome c-type biogenesis protein
VPDISGVSVLMAFLAGVVSFLSPCVLPLVPGYVAYVAGQSLDDLAHEGLSPARGSAIALSACFIVGFSAVFIALGASASALGQFLLPYRYEANYVAGAIVIAFGLFMMGVLRVPWLNRELRFGGAMAGGRPAGALVLGSAFDFGWTPCIGPILGTILVLSATTVSVAGGTALLAIYSAGLAVPFLLLAAFTGAFLSRLKAIRWIGRPLQAIAGAVMVLMGVAMITGYLSSFGFWLLETFPLLGIVLR